MNWKNATILISGGASGIGFALAKRFVTAGSKVIVCGRREEQLKVAKQECPALFTLRADVSTAAGRIDLHQRALAEFPSINVLLNNAGIQNRLPPVVEPQPWERHEQEIAINLHAPMHLSMLFLPQLLAQKESAIMNVTSGLAFAPISFMPTYCATKAALHSFTLSLRHQLKNTTTKVIEIIPPAVNTDLGGKGLHTMGAPLDAFADHAIAQILKGELEFGYETSETRRLAAHTALDGFFQSMNR